jgi:hypothetical protein
MDAALYEYVFTRDIPTVEQLLGHDVTVPMLRSLVRRSTNLRVSSSHGDFIDVAMACRGGRKWLTCPTVHYRWDLIRIHHDQLAHAGVNRTAAALRRTYFWRGMQRDIVHFVASCDPCQRFRARCPDVPNICNQCS